MFKNARIPVELEVDLVGAVVNPETVPFGGLRGVNGLDFPGARGQEYLLVRIGLQRLRLIPKVLADKVLAREQVGELIVARLVGYRCRLVITECIEIADSVVVQVEVDGYASHSRLGFDGYTEDRIDPEGVLFDLQQFGEFRHAGRPHQADEIVAVAGVEADLGTQSAQAVHAGGIAGSPVHRVVLEHHDIPGGVVLDVQRERIAGVGVGRIGAVEVAHVDPIHLDKRVVADAGSLRQPDFPAKPTLRIGTGVHVGPERRHNRCRLREPGRREGT